MKQTEEGESVVLWDEGSHRSGRWERVHAYVKVTSANEHDVTQAKALIREDDKVVYGDTGYTGLEKRPEIKSDESKSGIEYRINRRPGTLARKYHGYAFEFERKEESRKSSVRSKVKHPFRIVKVLFWL